MVAQTGSLAGTVSDLSGGVVPGAVVVIADADGHRRQTVSGANGTYGFTSVPYGAYKVHASAPQMELPEQIEVSIGSAGGWFFHGTTGIRCHSACQPRCEG